MSMKTMTFVMLTLTSTLTFGDDLSLEPCINGAVSSSGLFPSQEMEDQIFDYLQWQSGEPYYLFKVAGTQIPTPYPES